MKTNVDADEVVAHIGRYLQRAASGRERFVAYHGGQPIAAVVSVEDVARLEALDAGRQEASASAERETAFRRALEEAGLLVQWPIGSHGPLHERVLLAIAGPPLSEQIIADRR